jgi:hypothetical protein
VVGLDAHALLILALRGGGLLRRAGARLLAPRQLPRSGLGIDVGTFELLHHART